MQYSCNHHVNVRTEEHIRKDDRVYVAGYLSSKNQFLDNGQIRHILTIKGHHIQLKERNETTAAENDINQIKILAQICAEIRHTDKYSLFTVMATHTPRYFLFDYGVPRIYSDGMKAPIWPMPTAHLVEYLFVFVSFC